MKRFILSVIVFLLFSLSLANAATTDLTILPVSAVSGNPGDNVNIRVQVKNNGANSIDVVNVASSDLIFGNNNITKPAPTSITTLGSGQTKTATLSLTIPSTLAGAYVGTLSVSDATDSVNNPIQASYALTVNSIDGLNILNIDEATALEVTGQEDETRTVTFQLKNSGSTTYTPEFTYNQDDFSDGDKLITLSFSGAGAQEIKPGETKIVTITSDIENNINIDTYEGIITVNGNSATDTFKLRVRVHPEVCKDGPVGNELRLDVNEPDNGDDFAPGDVINIDVTVENDGNRKDVVLEAFLYNSDEDDEIERVESDSVRIGSDEEEDFELEFEIPFDSDISEDDEYLLFIKAFEDGDEDVQCVETQLDIDIERETNDVRIQNINIIPASAKPGDTVDISVSVINVGSKDEDDVFVRLTSNELGWDETSSTINLEDGESKDNDGVFRFASLKIPTTTDAGQYSILAVVNFDDGDKQADEFVTLTVLEGDGITTSVDESELRLQSISETGKNTFTANVVVVNEGTTAKTYDLSVDATWAETISPQTFTVNGGDSRGIQILIKAKANTPSGSYSGIISIKEAGTIIATETFNVAITEEASQITGFAISDMLGGTSGTVLFIIVDIVLIIIAIFFIRLIFKSGNSRKRPVVNTIERPVEKKAVDKKTVKKKALAKTKK